MARKKIYETTAKSIVLKALGLTPNYFSIDLNTNIFDPRVLEDGRKYIVKVDQGVKKRAKNGLLRVNILSSEVISVAKEISEQSGYTHFIVESMLELNSPEVYLSLDRNDTGILLSYNDDGGVDVESSLNSQKQVQLGIASSDSLLKRQLEDFVGNITTITEKDRFVNFLDTIVKTFEDNFFAFLEINPLVDIDGKFVPLDLAVLVDSEAGLLVDSWSVEDFVNDKKSKRTIQETSIKNLDEKSQASLKFEVLNPNGSFWMLLAGGGASITLADEFHNLGFGKEVANYGEYSGNPSADEMYLYTKNVLELIQNSSASKKTLVIAGAVANFTDVRITFNGIIKALNEKIDFVKESNLGIFARRGGPHAIEGLANLKEFMVTNNISGEVHGPNLPLTDIVKFAIQYYES